MFVLVRTIVYASLFIALVLIYVPTQLLSWSGIVQPASFGTPQIISMVSGAIGAIIALWCVFTFAFIGKGTPAPFDSPLRLVIRGALSIRFEILMISRRRTCPGKRCTFLQVMADLRVHGGFLFRNSFFCFVYEEPTLRKTFRQVYDKIVGRSNAGGRSNKFQINLLLPNQQLKLTVGAHCKIHGEQRLSFSLVSNLY